ncbi:hypothetical protein F7N58_24535 [Escherichia coli]|nr:hypothetical protein [Escherichia coli]
MCGICIAVAYVDARHMFSISLFLSFLSEIRKKVVTDLLLPPHNATSRQHNMWCRIQLLMTLYVVSSP